jgi:hypothetical protein
MNEVVIPLKLSGIAALKAELKDLKNQMADAANPEAFAALADKAGDVTKKINSVNSAVNDFKQGSNFDQAKASFDAMGESIMKLDFTKAAKQSANLKQTLGSLTSGDLTKQFTGLISTVKNLGGAFLKLGAQLLVNPIFLIVAIVVAVVLAFTIWEDKLGKFGIVLKLAFAPIYLAIQAIKLLIQGFKDMTDWLGLTSFAAEENAEKSLAANEKVSESSKNRTAIVTADLGREIAEAKAAGKDTTKLEKEKSNVQIKEANKRRNSARKALANQRKLGEDADQETIKKLKQQITEETELIKQGYSDKKVARLNDIAEAEADAEKAAEKAKAARDKFRAADKVSEDEIATAAKIVSDSKKTAQQIEIDDLKADYAIKIATAIKYKNDTTALIEAQKVQEAAIITKYDDEAKAKKAVNAAKAAAFNEDFAKTLAERLAKISGEYGLDEEQAADLRRRKEIKAQEDYYRELLLDAMQAKKDQKILDQIENERLKTLDDIEIKYTDAKIARAKTVTDKEIELDKKVFDAKMKNIDAGLKLTQSVGDAIAFMQDTNITAQLKKVKKGSKEEEVLLKKQFEQNKKAQLAAAIINAAQAQVSILAQYPKFDGGFAMVAAMAGAALTSAMAIGKITAASFSGGGSTPDAPDSSLTSTTAVAPVSGPNLFGNANTGSQVNAGGGSNNITVTAIVSETEITASQQHINNIQQNSVL